MTTSYARRERDFQWMGLVKQLPCVLAGVDGAGRCWGGIEVDHAGGNEGLSHKCADRETIPLCAGHHGQRTDRRGYFDGYNDERMAAWCAAAIDQTAMRVDWLLTLEWF